MPKLPKARMITRCHMNKYNFNIPKSILSFEGHVKNSTFLRL